MNPIKLMHLKYLLDLDDINKFLSWKMLKDNTLKTVNDLDSAFCPICLESDGLFVKTECGHHIHKDCMNNYLSNKCPMCRSDMYEEYEPLDTSVISMKNLMNVKQMIYYERLTGTYLTSLAFNFNFGVYDDIRDLFIQAYESRSFEVNLKLKHCHDNV